jgi:hypothetical protein
MSGIMTALVGSGGVTVVSFTVTVGTGTNSNGTTTQTFWGFSNVGVPTGGTNGLYYPNSVSPNLNIGSVSPATPTIGAIEVIGAYSIGVSSSSIATYYAVILEGDVSATPNLISNMYVDGNQVVYSAKTVTYFPLTRDNSNVSGSAPSTLFLFTLTATAATLFGTTAGVTKTVSIY